jgi:hypothetical protein
LSRVLFTVVLALVLIPSGSAMRLSNTNITAEATSSAGANVDFPVASGTTCDYAPNSLFPIGTTHVTCTLDSDPSQFDTVNVKVVDTTPPDFGPLSDVLSTTTTVVFDIPAPPDVNGVSEPVVVACTPSSGSSFPVGTTHVSCTATDARGNVSSAGFDVIVTLTDDQPPTFTNIPPNSTTEATGPSGAAVSWTIAATDNLDPNPTIVCDHTSGSTFPVGTTPVDCTATDSAGNVSSPHASFSVTVTDSTPPVLTLPGNQNVETEDPAGKAVTFSVTASDIVSGSIAPSCNHASGDTFPIGTTPVHCTATDAAQNSSSGDFNVTVTLADHTAPVLSGYGDKTVEANGPAGSVVNFPTPTALDAVDGPVGLVPCTPPSGTTFPLGTTAVHCTATDAHGNVGDAGFNVTVQDTTPPVLAIPASFAIHATTADGIPRSNATISGYLASAVASDIVDLNPVITNSAPDVLPIGTTDVTWFARDASGNVTSQTATIVVLPKPPPGTPPLPVPGPPTIPAEVKNVTVTPLDGAVRIQWDAGGRRVEVIRSTSSSRTLSALVDEKIVYSGTASSYVDRGLENGVEYRYVVRAVDAAGNHSAGVAAVVAPRVDLLKSPKNGARLKKAPKLVWRLDAEAAYYNAQLLLNGVKVLSVWPTRTSYLLKKSWKYNGRKYTLKPGLYTWFVWPGYGSRATVDYGPLMGSRTFRIVR